MIEGQITFRLDPHLKARIRELVAAGEFRSVSDFMNQAVLLKFEFDRIPVNGRTIGEGPLDRYFDSPRGRQQLRELVLEALGDDPVGTWRCRSDEGACTVEGSPAGRYHHASPNRSGGLPQFNEG